jgi:hypothetical protein
MRTLVPFLLLVALVGCGATVDPESGNTPQPLKSNPDSANADTSDDEAPCGESATEPGTKVPNAEQEADVPPKGSPAPDDCGIEIKRCYAAGGDEKKCEPLAEKCAVSTHAEVPTESGSPEIEACLIKAKQCYVDGMDPEECLAIEKFCAVMPPEPTNVEPSSDAPTKPGTVASGSTDPGCAKKILACLEANIDASICAMLSDACATEAKLANEPSDTKPPADKPSEPSDSSKPELI